MNKKEIKHGKRNFGIFLIILQCLAIYGLISSGDGFPTNIPGLIGFFIFGIIGVILIILDFKSNK